MAGRRHAHGLGPLMFLLDSENRFTLVADSLADRVEQTAGEIRGKRITTLLAQEDVSTVLTALSRLRDEPELTSQILGCRLLVDGNRHPVEIELSLVADQSRPGDVMGAIHDETATRARERATDERIRFHHLFDLLDDAVVEFEIRGDEPIVRAVNDAFETIFGYQAEYVVGSSLNDYIVPQDGEAEANEFDKQLSDGNANKGVVTRQTVSGTREFFYRGLPAGTEDNQQYGIAIYTDITAEQQARQHLQVLHRVLRHNLRNTLTVIIGMVDQITTQTASERIETAADRIEERAKNLEGVSENARIAENILGEPPSGTIVGVGVAANAVVSAARDDWPDVTITTDIETPLPVETGLEIRDALENLVENAIKHNSGQRAVRVTARKQTPIHSSTRAFGQNVIITVEDNGPGIPQHERAVVFDEEDMTQLKHGSGLGLWVVRWIIESANGTITYDRTDGWTTLEIKLPLATDELNDGMRPTKES